MKNASPYLLVLFVIIAIIGTSCVMYLCDNKNNEEIESSDYSLLSLSSEKGTESNHMMNEALRDEKITRAESHHIWQQIFKERKESEKVRRNAAAYDLKKKVMENEK